MAGNNILVENQSIVWIGLDFVPNLQITSFDIYSNFLVN